LPRYAGPIAEFILTHADATRYDIIEFIQRTWNEHVSTVALHHFCKKFGLDRGARAEAKAPKPSVNRAATDGATTATRPLEVMPSVTASPPPFSRCGPTTRARSS
jgi:hypothetical protein